MLNQNNKLMFITMMVTGSLITLSAKSWLTMWMGLEINLMGFIPLINSDKNNYSAESMMIYFLVQSVSSSLFLISLISNQMLNNIIMEIPTISMMMKLGAAPFHSWLPMMMNKMNWNTALLLMTWQKIAPMSVLCSINNDNKLMNTMILLSTIVGAIGGLGQTSLQKMMAYSSISHTGWMIMYLKYSNKWVLYLMLYMLLMMMITHIMESENIYSMNQFFMAPNSMMEKYAMTSLLMSMGGLPPFMGFIPKWMVIQSTNGDYTIIMIMMFMSMITLLYYTRMCVMYMMYNQTLKIKLLTTPNNPIKMISILNLITPIIMMIKM